jgi:hypothetical protein
LGDIVSVQGQFCRLAGGAQLVSQESIGTVPERATILPELGAPGRRFTGCVVWAVVAKRARRKSSVAASPAGLEAVANASSQLGKGAEPKREEEAPSDILGQVSRIWL